VTELEITREIRAPIATVFDALTDAHTMEQWFAHGPGGSAEIRMDPVVGGAYSFTLRRPGPPDLTATGVFVAVEPPHHLAFTWNTHLTRDSIVTIVLVEKEGSTRLTLRHELPPELHGPHAEAWNATLDNLAALLDTAPG
jgi:uncharacterized protein YndB with AHSA1/START domain